MADENVCQENDLCLNESDVSANNVQRKNWKEVLCEKGVKYAWVLTILFILLNIVFVILDQSGSQENNSFLNKTEERPQIERLVSNDHRCLATVQKIQSPEHTDEECIAQGPAGIKYKKSLNWTRCENNDSYIKTKCICEGFNLSRFPDECKSPFDVNRYLVCKDFNNTCRDFWNDTARILSCPNDKYVKEIKCGRDYTGHFCQNKIQAEFVTCDRSLNKFDGMPPCKSAGQNQECFIYQDDSELVCIQGKSIKSLPLCDGTKINSPLHSSMKSNDKQDSPRTYSGKNEDLPIQIVLIVLEIILVVLNTIPVIYLKCGGQNKANCQLFLTAVSVVFLIFNAVLSALLASRNPSPYGMTIVIVSCIFIFMAFLLRFGDFYSVIRRLPNPCSMNE